MIGEMKWYQFILQLTCKLVFLILISDKNSCAPCLCEHCRPNLNMTVAPWQKCMCYLSADVSSLTSMYVFSVYTAFAWGLSCQPVLLYVCDSWHQQTESLTAWAITDVNAHRHTHHKLYGNLVIDNIQDASLTFFLLFFFRVMLQY